MTGFRFALASAACSLAVLLVAPDAMAQATRTWVSGVGDDANPCSRTAPCKTFAGAISKTAANGIINVLDPGGFGAVTITKSITIDGSGGSHAGVLITAAGNGINVNGSGITVVLRNLALEGIDSGGVGINFLQGARVQVERCRIYGFRTGNAMAIRMTAAGTLMVRDSTISDSGVGIQLEAPSGGTINATIDSVLIEDTAAAGIRTAGLGSVNGTVKRSTIHSNGLNGVRAATSATVLTLVDNSISHNGAAGVSVVTSGATVRVSGNTIVDNGGGAFALAAGGNILTDQTNRVSGGGSAPTWTFVNQ